MIDDVVYGDNLHLYVDGVLVACGKSISVKSTRKEITTTCAGSGDIETAKTGKAKHTFTIDNAWRITTGADVATNVTAFEFWEKYLANEEVTIVFAPSASPVADDVVYTGVGYIKDIESTGQMDEQGTNNIQGFFNELDIVKVPA